jgi:predicted ATPase/DNA-binding CsgD family transcriptional regulator
MGSHEQTHASSPLWKIPTAFTSLIGREREITAIQGLLTKQQVRLLTLTGAAGVGKTRLSLEVAMSLRSCFSDGVCFVELATLSDPDLVLSTLAERLEIKEGTRELLTERLKRSLHDKHLLLLLDNFERLLSASPLMEDLLSACPALHIVVTSRTPLRLRAESLFPVAPLALPDLSRLPEPELLARIAAVALFLQRAQAIRPDLQLLPANARAIAEICVRLDGLPLAIELAAARLSILSPQDLLDRLSSRLGLLTRGAWDLPERQQTLRKTLQWSYSLLSAEERQLFRCLSVFVGGCTMKGIEVLWARLHGEDQGREQVLDGVASLIEKSLLHRTELEGQEPRFRMLETIREYGLETLAACQELEAAQRAHAACYLALVEEAQGRLQGKEHGVWVQRLTQEHDNLRAALRWLLEQGEDREAALRMCSGLDVFWVVRGDLLEGWTFLEQALAQSQEAAPAVRTRALLAGVVIAMQAGDLACGEALCQEYLRVCRALGDTLSAGAALCVLGWLAYHRKDFAAARSFLEEGLAIARELGYKPGVLISLLFLAYLAHEQGDDARLRQLCQQCLAFSGERQAAFIWPYLLLRLADLHFLVLADPTTMQRLLSESLAIFQERNDTLGTAECSRIAAQAALLQGDVTTARRLAEKSLKLSSEVGARPVLARSLALLGRVLVACGELGEAGTLYTRSLVVAKELEDQWRIAPGLEGLAGVVLAQGEAAWAARFGVEGLASIVAAQGEFVWAARLWGLASTLPSAMPMRVSIPAVEPAAHERAVAAARARLGEQAFAEAMAEGRTMSLSQVLAWQETATLAEPLPSVNPAPPAVTPAPTSPHDLTEREVQVLRLLAQGLTNAQIAERLVVSPHTVRSHVKAIYSKLGVTSRSAATRFALEHHLG